MVNYGFIISIACLLCGFIVNLKSVYEMKVIFVKFVRPVHITFHKGGGYCMYLLINVIHELIPLLCFYLLWE